MFKPTITVQRVQSNGRTGVAARIDGHIGYGTTIGMALDELLEEMRMEGLPSDRKDYEIRPDPEGGLADAG